MECDYKKLLLRRIHESGLSQRQWAKRVVYRDERTIRRWLSGESPVPSVIFPLLDNPSPAPWPPPRA